MTTQNELLKLAERCEAATGPNRDLNIAMLPLVGLRFKDEGHPIGRVCYDANNRADPMPQFTASLDAAMTLVPEGCDWTLSVAAYEPCLATIPSGDDRTDAIHAPGATPALALTAAALRARANQASPQQGDGE